MTPKQEEKLRRNVLKCSHLSFQQKTMDALRTAQKVMIQVVRAGHKGLEGQMLVLIAGAYRMQGKVKEKEECYRKLIDLYPHIEQDVDCMIVSSALGAYYRECSDFIQALEYCYKALFLAEKLGGALRKVYTLHSLGVTLTATGNYSAALEKIFQGIRIIEGENLIAHGISRLYDQAANIYGLIKDYENGIIFCQKSLALLKKLDSPDSRASVYETMGWNYLYLDDNNNSNKYFQKSLKIRLKIPNINRVPILLVGLGANYGKRGDFDKAIKVFNKAHEQAKKNNQPLFVFRALLGNANALLKQGKYSVALEILNTLAEMINSTNHTYDKFNMHESFSEVYEALGDHKEAYKHKVFAEKLEEELRGAELQKSIVATEVAETLYRLEKKQKELEERTRKAEAEAKHKEEQLQEVSANLSQSMKTLKEVEETVKPYLQKSDGELKTLAESIYKGLSKTIKTQRQQSPDKYFDKSYQEFIQRLHKSHTILTPAEIKVCILIKLNYSNKQMGELLNVSELTIKTHRARIRKKMGLHRQENLLNVLLRV